MKRKAESTTNGKAEGMDLRGLTAIVRQVMLPMVAGIVTANNALRDWVARA